MAKNALPRIDAHTYEITSIGRLKEHPKNPNQGDVGAIVELIKRHGFRTPIEAQLSTGYVIAGNHRLQAARSLGMPEVPVLWVDISDREAMERLLADNRARDLAAYDDSALVDLLAELAGTKQGLEGTGFDGDDLDMLLSSLDTPLRYAPDAIEERKPQESVDEYLAGTVRSIILALPVDEYIEVIDALAVLRSEYGVDTNSDVVLKLVRDAVRSD